MGIGKIVFSKWSLILILVSPLATPIAFARTFKLPPSIQSTVEALSKNPTPADERRLNAIAALIQKLEVLQPPTLDEALARSDLTPGTLKTLAENSMGVVSLNELLHMPMLERGYSLGLSARAGIYELLSERFQLIPWTEAYPEFEIDWHKVKNHTEVFLNRVQMTGKPVVFFLPNQTLTYTKPSITIDEFKWYLQDPKRMAKVLFVVGVYEVIGSDLETLRQDAGFSSDEFRALFMRSLGAASSSYDE